MGNACWLLNREKQENGKEQEHFKLVHIMLPQESQVLRVHIAT